MLYNIHRRVTSVCDGVHYLEHTQLTVYIIICVIGVYRDNSYVVSLLSAVRRLIKNEGKTHTRTNAVRALTDLNDSALIIILSHKNNNNNNYNNNNIFSPRLVLLLIRTL